MEDALRQALTLGRGFYENKEYAKAEPYLLKVVADKPGFADIHNMLGVIYHDQGQFEKAQRFFEEAVRINPAYTEAALNLAVTYNDQGMYREASAIYRQALSAAGAERRELDPYVVGKIANMYADIGDVFASCGALRQAIVEYQRALTLRPAFVDIRLKLANAYRDLGDRDSALREFNNALEQNPSFIPALLNRGITRYAAGDYAGAMADLDQVLLRDPEHQRAKLYLTMLQDRQEIPGDGAPPVAGAKQPENKG